MIGIAKTRRIGGSIVVTIPIEVVKIEDINEDEWIEVEVKKHKKDYFGALKEIGKFTKEDRMQDREI